MLSKYYFYLPTFLKNKTYDNLDNFFPTNNGIDRMKSLQFLDEYFQIS